MAGHRATQSGGPPSFVAAASRASGASGNVMTTFAQPHCAAPSSQLRMPLTPPTPMTFEAASGAAPSSTSELEFDAGFAAALPAAASPPVRATPPLLAPQADRATIARSAVIVSREDAAGARHRHQAMALPTGDASSRLVPS